MKTNRKQILLASAAAGLLLGTTLAIPNVAQAEDVECYGVNKCKAVGECGGKGHSCAGKNQCAGKGYITLAKEKCLKIKGGRLTPEPKGK